MTGTITHLALACGLFLISHFGLSLKCLRIPISERIGYWGFKGLYGLVAFAAFAWMTMAYLDAPNVSLFAPPVAFQHGSLTLMLIAAFFVVTGYTTPNPAIMGMESAGLASGPRGVLKITRHPVMWGVAFWGTAHVLASGHLAALIFFGGLTALALGGALHIDAKRRASHGEAWAAYEAETSFIPLGAILAGRIRVEKGEVRWWQSLLTVGFYVGMLAAHAEAGRDVFPMGFF